MRTPDALGYSSSKYDAVTDVRDAFREFYGEDLGLNFDTALGRYPPFLTGETQVIWTVESDNLSVSMGYDIQDPAEPKFRRTDEGEIEAILSQDKSVLGEDKLTQNDVALMDLMYQAFEEPEIIRSRYTPWNTISTGRNLINYHIENTELDF